MKSKLPLFVLCVFLSAGGAARGQDPPMFTSPDSTTFTVGTFGWFVVTTNTLWISLEVGVLPAGVSANSCGPGCTELSGTPLPAAGGYYPLIFCAGSNEWIDVCQSFTFFVVGPPVITSPDVVTFGAGVINTFTIRASGWPYPSISGDLVLPDGLSFTDNGDSTATLRGTPAAGTDGTYPLTISASNGLEPDANQFFTLTVAQPESPTITSPTSVTFIAGLAAFFTVTTSGIPSTMTITYSGDLLPYYLGFFDSGNGTASIVGTPPPWAYGTYRATLRASNGVAPDATVAFTLKVVQLQAPRITSPNSATFTGGVESSFSVTTAGFPAVTSISESGTLPNGLIFTNNGDGTATIAGIPASGSVGIYPLMITATNGIAPDATQAFTLIVLYQTTAEIMAAPTTTGYLQPTTLVARITSVPPGNPVPDGPVQFVDGDTMIGTATLSSGVGQLVVNGLSSGEHVLKAVYGGHSAFNGSMSAPVKVTVQGVDTSTFTLLIPWRNPQATGRAAIFTAVVLPLGAGSVTGAVQFIDIATTITTIGTASVVNGLATVATNALAPGLHLIGARYLGANGMAASSAAPVLQTVYLGSPPVSTSMTLATSSSPSTLGQPVTFTATFSGGAPTGSVYFFSDGLVLGPADVTDVDGVVQAVFTTSGLSAGIHVISAAYLGDSVFASSNAPLIGQIVQAPGSEAGATGLPDVLTGRR